MRFRLIEHTNIEVDSLGNELTDEQASYFRNSKVRDRKGNLLVCYHGTDSRFDTFEKGDIGFHFGTESAANARREYKDNPNDWYVDKYYLNIENYIDTYDIADWDGSNVANHIVESRMLDLTEEEIRWLQIIGCTGGFYDEDSTRQVRDFLISKGIDGFMYENAYEDAGSLSFIVFSPNQVKRVSNQKPTESDNLNEKIVSNKDVVSTLAKRHKKYIHNVREITIPEAREYIISKYDDEDIQKIVNFVNSLEFPLKVYRGLQAYGKSFSVDLERPGRHWTVDTKLFTSSNSRFKSVTHILCGYVDEDDVDWGHTIDTFAHYSLRPSYGAYPEMEVTLKKNVVPRGLAEVSIDSLNEDSNEIKRYYGDASRNSSNNRGSGINNNIALISYYNSLGWNGDLEAHHIIGNHNGEICIAPAGFNSSFHSFVNDLIESRFSNSPNYKNDLTILADIDDALKAIDKIPLSASQKRRISSTISAGKSGISASTQNVIKTTDPYVEILFRKLLNKFINGKLSHSKLNKYKGLVFYKRTLEKKLGIKI